MERKDILRAFFSMNMWHVRSVYTPNSQPYYTFKDQDELFIQLREKGFELLCTSPNHYFFKEL